MSWVWTLHKRSKIKHIRSVLKFIQRRLFDPQCIFAEYHRIVINHRAAVRFMVQHRELIVNVCGRNVMRELILNFRTRVGYRDPNKLVVDFDRYVVTKTVHHSSDLAIACNLLKYTELTINHRRRVIQFVVDRLGANDVFDNIHWSNILVKQQMVIDRVRRTGKYNQ